MILWERNQFSNFRHRVLFSRQLCCAGGHVQRAKRRNDKVFDRYAYFLFNCNRLLNLELKQFLHPLQHAKRKKNGKLCSVVHGTLAIWFQHLSRFSLVSNAFFSLLLIDFQNLKQPICLFVFFGLVLFLLVNVLFSFCWLTAAFKY